MRAVDLFFNPENYDSSIDRPTLKQAQGGASINPKIIIEFYVPQNSYYYSIVRDFKVYEYKSNYGLSGEKYMKSETGNSKKANSKVKLDESFLVNFLDKFEFKYIESINVNIPKIVEQLTDDIIDVEYERARFTESKKELKKAYEQYTNGLQNILDTFSKSITDTFNSFKNNWNISFNVPKSVDTFRDLISDDVELYIDDKGCNSVEQKGSGLQRLAVILLHFEILKRLKKTSNIIICIDEPDIYLHEGLQKKLMNFFEDNSNNMQIIYTTHSKIFINQYSMKNVILLDSNIYEQFSARKKKSINVSETTLVDISLDDGYDKICDHLGIEKSNYDILERGNILVEGGCDKNYLEQLGGFFDLELPKIIAADGVNNFIKYLDFYDSYYKNNTTYSPKIKVLFDNDSAGRDEYNKIKNKLHKYKNIDVKCVLIQNFNYDNNKEHVNKTTNNEIEDLLYPEILLHLSNKILINKSYCTIHKSNITKKIMSPSFQNNGILSLIENEKNSCNLENGHEISFTSIQIKKSLSELFKISGDKDLLKLMNECRTKYTFVEKFVKELFVF